MLSIIMLKNNNYANKYCVLTGFTDSFTAFNSPLLLRLSHLCKVTQLCGSRARNPSELLR